MEFECNDNPKDWKIAYAWLPTLVSNTQPRIWFEEYEYRRYWKTGGVETGGTVVEERSRIGSSDIYHEEWVMEHPESRGHFL